KTLASGSTDWAYHRGMNLERFEGRDPGSHCEWKLWDTATGHCKRTVNERGRISSIAFSPNGQVLACGAGHEIRIYNFRAESAARVVATHDADVTALAIAPNGKALYSGSHDKTVMRIDPATGTEAWRTPGYWEQVNSVAIAPDGALIATGSSDQRIAQRK